MSFPVAKNFSEPRTGDKARCYCMFYNITFLLSLRKRHTVFVDSVEHSLSVWDSVKGIKNAFDISLIRKRRVFGIGDIAVFLVRNTRRLNSWTANKSAGNWAFKKFEIQSSILFKLFDPIFGKSQMIQWRDMHSQKSKTIKNLIVAYFKSIEI